MCNFPIPKKHKILMKEIKKKQIEKHKSMDRKAQHPTDTNFLSIDLQI